MAWLFSSDSARARAEQASFDVNFGRAEGQAQDELWSVDTRKHLFRILRREGAQPGGVDRPPPPSHGRGADAEELQVQREDCCVCFETPVGAERMVTPCAHMFCRPCLRTWYNQGKKDCPLCRGGLRSFGRANGLYEDS